MTIAISPMTADNLESVIALWSNSDGVGLNESDTPAALKTYLARNPGLSLVARVSQANGSPDADANHDDIVGAVLCGHDGRRGCLYHLAVVREYRRHGVGQRLVQQCLASLREQGIDRCNIFVYPDNKPAHQFWRSCGWAIRVDLQILQRATGL